MQNSKECVCFVFAPTTGPVPSVRNDYGLTTGFDFQQKTGFFLRHEVETSSRVHSASSPTGVLSPGGKVASV
jgi:hypothetical protein